MCWGTYALKLLVGQQEGYPTCKNLVVGCWHGYLSGTRCRLAYGPGDATATHCLSVLPFWHLLTRVVPDKGPWNVCLCVCMCVCGCVNWCMFSLQAAVLDGDLRPAWLILGPGCAWRLWSRGTWLRLQLSAAHPVRSSCQSDWWAAGDSCRAT